MRAVITVDKIDKQEAGYIHFKCKAQKAWNCNVQECIAILAEGERYYIDYNESQPSGGRKYGSKYINKARFWKEEDGENTWKDKEPYTGGGGSYSGGSTGGGNVKKDFDPKVSMRQSANNGVWQFLGHVYEGSGAVDLDKVTVEYHALADIAVQWIEGPKSDSGMAGAGSKENPSSDSDNFDF